jgi:hypothetical protein
MERRRRFQRIGLFAMPVAIRAGGTIRGCTIVDLSLSGARIKLEFQLQAGATVALRHGAYGDLPANVVWVANGEAGLAFSLTEDTVRYVTDMLIDRLKSNDEET